jgi:hypothetical protein
MPPHVPHHANKQPLPALDAQLPSVAAEQQENHLAVKSRDPTDIKTQGQLMKCESKVKAQQH